MLKPSLAEQIAYADHGSEIEDEHGFIWRMQTTPQLLRDAPKRWGENKPALRKKRYGIWNTITWLQYYENVKYTSLGLISLGFEKGNTISIIGDNDPEWWYCQIGAQAACGIGLGIFIDCRPSEIEYYVKNSDSVLVAAKDQEQCDKLLEIKDKIPQVKRVIFWEPKGMWKYDDPWLIDIRKVIEMGKEYEKTNPHVFDENVDRGTVDDAACIGYTSGTTGMPKGAVSAYRGLTGFGAMTWQNFPCYEGGDYLSYLCPAWPVDQTFGIVAPIQRGMVVNFAESPSSIQQDAREISPLQEFAGARMWEERYRNIQMQLASAGWLKNLCYKLALPIGYKCYASMQDMGGISWFWRTLYRIAYLIVFRPLKDKFGYTNTRLCGVAGSMLSPDLFRYFQAVGIPLYANFSASELGTVSSQNPKHAKLGTTGPMLPGVNVRISNTGEILVYTVGNPQIVKGYYHNEEAMRAKMENGWYHTGDAGGIDEEGNLVFFDRVEEMMMLRGGMPFSPTYLESQLRCSKYIKDAIIFGNQQDWITAIVEIDLQNVGQWAESNYVTYTTFVDLSQKSEIYDLIFEEIRTINMKLTNSPKIMAFVNLYKELDADEAELTRTRKLKRNVLESKYATILEAIYSGKTEIKVRSEVTYRDGRTGMIAAILKPRFYGVEG